jgi:2-keto-3-deoxy-L-rhamnonate aldolase RhmA
VPILNHLKRKLAAGQCTLGLWVTLEAPSITEIAGEMGLDWVVVDTEHGHLGYREVLEHVRALRGTDTTPLVRIPEISEGGIKRVLDLGAQGILVPQVRSAADVRAAVRWAKYPPAGERGLGGERAVGWGLHLPEYTAVANAETLVIPLIEHVEAARNLAEILAEPGVDAVQLGPADFSASAGYLGQWEGPGVAEQLLAVKDAAGARGLACGVLARHAADLRLRRDQGFRFLGLGSDTVLIIRGIREARAALAE